MKHVATEVHLLQQTMQHCQDLGNTFTVTSTWRHCFFKSSNPDWYSQETYSNSTFCGKCFIHYAKTMMSVKITVKKGDLSLYQLVFPILPGLFWACLQTTVWKAKKLSLTVIDWAISMPLLVVQLYIYSSAQYFLRFKKVSFSLQKFATVL